MAATSRAKKTDNSYLEAKVNLRAQYLPQDPVVLDCYAGTGKVWQAVEHRVGFSIKRLGIDIRKDNIGFRLIGDNRVFLMSMDLSKFNVIDLDAYGVPFAQLKMVFDRGWHGVIFITFIQSITGNMPFSLYEEIGFTRVMVRKAPTLFSRRGYQYFLEWLANNGVQSVLVTGTSRKHYMMLKV